MNVETIEWNEEKNQSLIEIREVSFDLIAQLIREGDILDVYDHPNQERYPGQQMLVVRIDDYAYLIPFVEPVSYTHLDVYKRQTPWSWP